MIREEDQVLAKLIARHNLLPPEAIASGMAALESSDRLLKEILVERGLLTRAQVHELERLASRVMQGGPIPGYEMIERVGRGGMGAVYRAKQLSMGGRTVALKVVRLPRGRDRRNARRLLQEAKIVGGLDHPNMVKGYDVGVAGDYCYFVMEFIDGESLRDVLQRKRLDPATALRVTRHIASALVHAHEHGVVHRDVKPGNILITRDGVPKLTDLGLAKGPRDSTLTRSGVTLGTPQYISPEQAKSPSAADARSDIYSLGATLYHMVTGIPPYQGDTLASVISQVLFEPYVPPEDLNPDLGPDLCTLIDKMMVKDPERRYPDTSTLLRDIDAVLEGEIIDPVPLESFEATRPRRIGAWVGVAVLVLSIAGVVYAIVDSNMGSRGSKPAVVPKDPELAALARAIRDADRRYPIEEWRRTRLLVEAASEWAPLADAYPEARVPRERLAALERRFERAVSDFYVELAAWVRETVPSDEAQTAISTFENEAVSRFSERFGREPDEIPADWRDARRSRHAQARAALIEWVSDTEVGVFAKALAEARRSKDPRVTIERVRALRRRFESEREQLTAEAVARIDGALSVAEQSASDGYRTAYEGELALAEQDAAEGRIRSAQERLANAVDNATFERFGSRALAVDARQAIDTARTRAIESIDATIEACLRATQDALGRRRIDEALAKLSASRGDVETLRDELERATEASELFDGFAVGIASIDRGYERVLGKLREEAASEDEVEIVLKDGERVRLDAVEGRRIRCIASANGVVTEYDLSDLRRDEVVERAEETAATNAERMDVAWLVLAEAWSEGLSIEERIEWAGRAAQIFETVSSAASGSGGDADRSASAGRPAFDRFVEALRSQSREEQARLRERAEGLLRQAESDLEANRYEAAIRSFTSLREPPLSRTLVRAEKRRVEDGAKAAERALRRAEFVAAFAGEVTFLDENGADRDVRITYEFDEPGELRDWRVGTRWTIENGRLVEAPRETDFTREGLVFPHRFDLLSDFRMTVEIVTNESPLPLYFWLSSFHGNSFGIMSGERQELCQLNFYGGTIDEFEDAFRFPDPEVGAPRGYPDPKGNRPGPRFEPGTKYALRFEIREEGRRFTFAVGDREWYATPIGNVRREGPIEIRTNAPHAFERIVIEGRIE